MSNDQVLQVQDLKDGKLDITNIAEVAMVGTTADTTTNREGVEIDTLQGRLNKLGFEPPLAYAAGITFTGVADSAKTIDNAGVIYSVLASSRPFTTTGNFQNDSANFFVIQNTNQGEGWNVIKLDETDIITVGSGNDNDVAFKGDMTLPYGRLLEFDITLVAKQFNLPIAPIESLGLNSQTVDYDFGGDRYRLSDDKGLLYSIYVAREYFDSLNGPKSETPLQTASYENNTAFVQEFNLTALPNTSNRTLTATGTIKGFATVVPRFPESAPVLPIDTPTTIGTQITLGIFQTFQTECKFLGGLIKWRYADSSDFNNIAPVIVTG